MNSKQQALVDLLKSASIALKYYMEREVCRPEEFMWYVVLEGKLNILEAFGEESEAQEAVNLIRGLIARIDKEEEAGWLLDFPTKVDEIENEIKNRTTAFIQKIEKA